MAFMVEQVDSEGIIVMDYDTSLSKSAIYKRLLEYFPKINKSATGMIIGEYEAKVYSIRIKNITYLGNPHPEYKKRIQIPNDLQEFYRESLRINAKPLLLGIYSYQNNTVFCDFNIEDYVNKKAHNSSAHIYTSDLAAATQDSYFQKVDYFGNRITAFSPNCVDVFLNEVFVQEDEISVVDEKEGKIAVEYTYIGKSDEKYTIEKYFHSNGMDKVIKQYVKSAFPDLLIKYIVDFFWQEKRDWNGIACYTRMIEANYRNKYQPEWPGFFLEFEFENYLLTNKLDNQIKYAQDKKNGGIDLDLIFPQINAYGDLKAHSSSSRGIQGNDLKTVKDVISSDKYYQHIYYIVCEHSTKKDSEFDYVVTEFWNKQQGKDNLRSYAKRMKYAVHLKKMYILDINQDNMQYLSVFKQGVNSNGKPREPKIMIEQDNMKYFTIFEMEM